MELTVHVEDDTYGPFEFERSAPPALQNFNRDERVVYIISFSKMLAPALRLGAVIAPMYMRLSFGVHPPERIEKGMATLGRVLAAQQGRRDVMSSLLGGAAGPLV